MPPHSLVETDTGRFAYVERGGRTAPLVLCLHGFPDHAPSFVPVMDQLAAAGYRAVAPWMRGYFPSVLDGAFDADHLGADVIALASALAPGGPVSLVGHDWGAVATYAALLASPDRFRCAVTMSVPHPRAFLHNMARAPGQVLRSWYMFFFQVPRVAERVVEARHLALIRRLWKVWSPGYELSPAAFRELERCLGHSLPAPLAYYRAMFRPDRAARQRLRDVDAMTIRVPVRYLHGDGDGCISASMGRGQERYFGEAFDSELVRCAGHFLQLEQPSHVARRIAEWLDRWHPV